MVPFGDSSSCSLVLSHIFTFPVKGLLNNWNLNERSWLLFWRLLNGKCYFWHGLPGHVLTQVNPDDIIRKKCTSSGPVRRRRKRKRKRMNQHLCQRLCVTLCWEPCSSVNVSKLYLYVWFIQNTSHHMIYVWQLSRKKQQRTSLTLKWNWNWTKWKQLWFTAWWRIHWAAWGRFTANFKI